MILYTYAFSSAAYRVRIALNLKGLSAEHRFVHLRKDGGQQFAPAYAALNPMREVPTLVDGERTISQSLAILEYLEETRPSPPLLPKDPYLRAKVRQVCETVNSGIHPLGNLKVFRYFEDKLKWNQDAWSEWYRHWIGEGVARLEEIVTPLAGRYAVGDQPTFADCCVIPQVFNCQRNKVDLSACATLNRLWEARQSEAAFAQAHPAQQPDAK
jgi:maleylpyruvate isomerase